MSKDGYDQRYKERVMSQTLAWAQGRVSHNNIDDECCPDFSCCVPELFEQDEAKRWAYYYEKYGMRPLQ